jgi:small-conductance mechanosensitive channel
MRQTSLIILYTILTATLAFGAADTNITVSARMQWADAELESAKQAHAATTNAAERALHQRRIELAEKALTNYRRQAELDQKERQISQARQRSTDFSLRKILSAIETDVQAPKHEISTHNTEIKKLKARRGLAEERRSRLAADPAATIEDQAVQESQLANYDAEIMSHMLARDTEELKIRLAHEASRIDSLFSSVEQEVRITLRMLLDGHRRIKRNRERLQEFGVIKQELNSLLEDTYSAAEITQQRVAQLQQETDILSRSSKAAKATDSDGSDDGKERRGVLKKLFGSGSAAERQLAEMIEDVEEEIAILAARIEHLQGQCVHMHNSLELIDNANQLFEAEYSFLVNRLVQLKKRYTRRVLMPIFIVLIIILIYQLISRFIFPLLLKHDTLFIARRLGSYGAVLVIMLVLIAFFLEDLKAIAAIMGIVGAAIVIALQDMCSAFAGWFVIVSSRKLRVGDRVEINGQRGEIIDIEMLRTTLIELNNWLGVDEATGRTLIIPNSFIFKSEVFNYSHVHPYIWGKVDITVTFESPPDKTYNLLFKALEDETRDAYSAAAKGGQMMERRYGTSRAIFEPHIHTVIADSGVCYSLFYAAHYRRFEAMRDRIMARVIRDVNSTAGVEFAYPTERHIPTPPSESPVVPDSTSEPSERTVANNENNG